MMKPFFRQDLLFVLLATLVATAAFVLFSDGAWRAPYLYGDDLPWEFFPFWYYGKLESEARWLVYAWNRVVGILPRSDAFLLSFLLWAVAAALVGRAVASKGRRGLAMAFAFALAANPAALTLWLWPHTLVPMVVALAFAMVIATLTERRPVLLAAGVAVATVGLTLTFQLFVFYFIGTLLAIEVAKAKPDEEGGVRRFVQRAGALLIGGGIGAVTGIVVAYSINWYKFGHFGLTVQNFRAAYAELLGANRFEIALNNMVDVFAVLDAHVAGGYLPFVLLAAVAMAILGIPVARSGSNGRRLIFFTAVIFVFCIAVVPFALPLLTGIPVTETRAAINYWLAAVMALLVVGLFAPGRSVTRAATVALVAVGVVGFHQSGSWLAALSRDGVANEAAAGRLFDTVEAIAAQGPVDRVLVAGEPSSIFVGETVDPKNAWWISNLIQWQVDRRLQPGVATVYCRTLADCPPDVARLLVRHEVSGWGDASVERRGGDLVIRLGSIADK